MLVAAVAVVAVVAVVVVVVVVAVGNCCSSSNTNIRMLMFSLHLCCILYRQCIRRA